MNRSKLIKKVEAKLERHQIKYDKHIAQTGSSYYILYSNRGDFSIKVRVSDHDDCYQTADITINPMVNQFAQLAEWVEKHGTKKKRKVTKGQFHVYGIKRDTISILAKDMTKKILLTCKDWFQRYDKIVVSKTELFTGGFKADLDTVDLSNAEEVTLKKESSNRD